MPLPYTYIHTLNHVSIGQQPVELAGKRNSQIPSHTMCKLKYVREKTYASLVPTFSKHIRFAYNAQLQQCLPAGHPILFYILLNCILTRDVYKRQVLCVREQQDTNLSILIVFL